MAGTSPAVDGLVNAELTQSQREAAQEEGHGSPVGPNNRSTEEIEADIGENWRPVASYHPSWEHNITHLLTDTETPNIETGDPLQAPDDDGRSRDSSSKYVEPVEPEEAVKLGYPSLNFRFPRRNLPSLECSEVQ